MHFVRTKPLLQKLASEPLPQRESFFYLFAFFAIYLIPAYSEEDVLTNLTGVSMTLIGTYLCYTANGGAKGTDFLSRYFSLSWVTFCQYMIIILPVSYIANTTFIDYKISYEHAPFAWTLVCLGAFYGILYSRFCTLKRMTEQGAAANP
jgi:hypothetical protein